MQKKRLVVGISGASGAPIAIELLKQLQQLEDWESHLVLSSGACKTIEHECRETVEQVQKLASRCYQLDDVGASISSGTFQTAGMVIVPCSMKTLAGVASGYSQNLLLRAADVTLKERRKLVLVTRESPLNRIHLRNMLEAVDSGAVVLPPVLTYYNHPADVEAMTNHIVGKILDIFDAPARDFMRWE